MKKSRPLKATKKMIAKHERAITQLREDPRQKIAKHEKELARLRKKLMAECAKAGHDFHGQGFVTREGRIESDGYNRRYIGEKRARLCYTCDARQVTTRKRKTRRGWTPVWPTPPNK